jgi:microcystin-dependent protein
MSEPFLGEIKMFGGNFAPRGYAMCWGQTLSIAQNTALFSILGTTYGGDGQTTFALPDYRGRVPMAWGQGPGLAPRTLGERSGTENVTLISTQMPAHNHGLNAATEDATSKSPTGNVLATTGGSAYIVGPIDTAMNPASIGIAGGNQPHNNMQPYLVVTFIIATEGIFPSRN